MAEDRFARLRNASLALKFSISIGDVTINYDGVLDACSEVERLRGLIVEFVAADDQLSPSKSMGSADHKRTIDRWEAAIKALKGAAVTKGET